MDGARHIEKFRVTNLLSFGANAGEVELLPLNVLIGPNGTGKSNFLESVALLRAIPYVFRQLQIRGGMTQWLSRRDNGPVEASISAIVRHPAGPLPLEYTLKFIGNEETYEIREETIRNAESIEPRRTPDCFYCFDGNEANVFYRTDVKGKAGTSDFREKRRLGDEGDKFDSATSILAQLRDYVQFPEISFLRDTFITGINIFRETGLAADEGAWPQSSEFPSDDYVREDLKNLAVVLGRLKNVINARDQIPTAMARFLEDFEGYDVAVEGAYASLGLQERRLRGYTSAKRLSGGTLRFLTLLAILVGQGRGMPQILCVEEPELGLHPDSLPIVAELLIEASQRMQIILTTHSDILVSAIGREAPESVLVCERGDEGTTMTRLVPEKLKSWLDQYTLGDVWLMGELGGKRW